MDHIPMMQDRVEEGLGGCGCGSVCQQSQRREHYAQQTRLMQLTRFIVWGYLFVVTVLLALLVVFIFGNGNGHGCQQCQHTPAAADPLPAQQQKQVQRHQNPSALLTASTSTTDGRIDRLAWDDTNGHAHLYGEFSYCNDYLIVPRNGLYRVYLQITYAHLGKIDVADCTDGDRDTLMLSHVVYRENEGYGIPLKLLSAVHTVNCSVTYWQKTMYSAAMFDLKENDKLWVSSSHPSLIVVKEDQVFFGVDFQSE